AKTQVLHALLGRDPHALLLLLDVRHLVKAPAEPRATAMVAGQERNAALVLGFRPLRRRRPSTASKLRRLAPWGTPNHPPRRNSSPEKRTRLYQLRAKTQHSPSTKLRPAAFLYSNAWSNERPAAGSRGRRRSSRSQPAFPASSGSFGKSSPVTTSA